MLAAFFAVAAAVVVVLNRKTMFDRSAGATDVLPHEYAAPVLAAKHA